MSIEEAKRYLMKDPARNRITAIYDGETRQFFYNQNYDHFGMYLKDNTKFGYIFSDWEKLSEIKKSKKKA